MSNLNSDLRLRFHELVLEQKPLRIVTYGDSNTEQFMYGAHWTHMLDVSLRNIRRARSHRVFNMGVGGDNTRHLLARFQDDVSHYQPHVVFLMIGLNDANPKFNLDGVEFLSNIRKIFERIESTGALPVFQTYFTCPEEEMDVQRYQNHLDYVSIFREFAQENQIHMIDQFESWNQLKTLEPQIFKGLFEDALHINSIGHQFFSLVMHHALDLELEVKSLSDWKIARRAFQIILGGE